LPGSKMQGGWLGLPPGAVYRNACGVSSNVLCGFRILNEIPHQRAELSGLVLQVLDLALSAGGEVHRGMTLPPALQVLEQHLDQIDRLFSHENWGIGPFLDPLQARATVRPGHDAEDTEGRQEAEWIECVQRRHAPFDHLHTSAAAGSRTGLGCTSPALCR